jgi:catechol 2,3-dioxygenase-like lactoylglutathione lyase family enzyme
MLAVNGIVETALHVEDVARSAAFYRNLFGFEVMVADDRLCAMNAGGRDVLLLFRKGGTSEAVVMPGGVIPPHGGDGHLHFAFAVNAADLQAWVDKLAEAGVPIESAVEWERGGKSLYFRDPDGHLVELATPGIWPNY